MRMSVAIPCYEIDGKGYELIEKNLSILSIQTFKDFEVIISDQSLDNKIKDVCSNWSNRLDIKYFKDSNRGSCPANTNNALRNCSGDIIKILFQDDYLSSLNSLQIISDSFDEDTIWLASAYVHTKDNTNFFNYHLPTMNDKIYVVNTIGTPSCITIRNKDKIYLDEDLHVFCDCEYYKRIYDKFGMPKIISTVTMVNFIWDGQLTNSDFVNSKIDKERLKVIYKYES